MESRFEALRTATTPLVGRDEEMALLMRRWEQAKAGEGQIVLVSGEPGIGKSRLAQTMVERLAGEPHIRLRFFCSPHHQDSALYPVIAHLERAAGFRRDDTAEQRLDKLEALLAQATNDVSAVAPLLADLLSVPTGERYPPLNLTPQKRKEKTLAALTAQVEGLSAREPVLMVYEDVHWSDPTTRESLDLLVDRAIRAPHIGDHHLPAGVCAAVDRPSARDDAHAQPAAAATARRDDRACDRWQSPPEGDRRPDRRSHRRRAAVHRGIDQVGGRERPGHGSRRQLRGDGAGDAAGNPDIAARFAAGAARSAGADAGGGADRRGARPFVLARADQRRRSDAAAEAGRRAGATGGRRVDLPARNAARRRVHFQARTGAGCRVQHLSAKPTAADPCAHCDHRWRGNFPKLVATQPQLLAHHVREAGLTEKAISYWLKAGQQAVARSAMVEAVTSLRKGLDQSTGLSEGLARQQQELDLLIALVPALIATKGYSAPEVGETLSRATALAEQVDRTDYLLMLLYGQFAYYNTRCDFEPALLFAKRLEQIGGEQNNTAALLQGRLYRGISYYWLGEFERARELFEQCHGLGEPAIRQTLSGRTAEDCYSLMLGYLGSTLAYLGYFDQARLRSDEGALQARQLRQAYTLGFCLLFQCFVAVLTSSPHEVRRHAEEMSDIANEHGFPLWTSCCHGVQWSVVCRDRTGKRGSCFTDEWSNDVSGHRLHIKHVFHPRGPCRGLRHARSTDRKPQQVGRSYAVH